MLVVERIVVGKLEENCYVISVGNECLIVDPGDEAEKIKGVVGSKRVLAILITHHHFDHVGALDELKKFYGVPVVDFRSDHQQRLNDFCFEIIDTKGHKDDSVTYYFKEDGVMFTGDFIFKGTVGRCDLLGGDFNQMIKSIERIKRYDENIIIYPGHGDMSTLYEEMISNPYMKGCYDE